MKKITFLLLSYVLISSNSIVAMDAMELGESEMQLQAFDDFMKLRSPYDRKRLLAYIKRDDIDLTDARSLGGTCLHIACLCKDDDIVRILLNRSDIDKNAIQIDCLKEYNTSLIIACQRNRISTVEALLEHNVDINYENAQGKTAFYYACSGNNANPEIVSLLLARDDLNMSKKSGNSDAILGAAENGNVGVLNVLYDCEKVNKDKKDKLNRNAFYLFVQNGNSPCQLSFFNMLISDQISDQKKEFLLDQLHQAMYLSSCGSMCNYHYDKIAIFIAACKQCGADLNARNVMGKRLIDIAEDEYNYLKGHVSYANLAWKKQIIHTFLRYTPYIKDHELFYVLKNMGLDGDMMRLIFTYYYMVTIERDVAFAMPTGPREYRSKCDKRSMRLLRNQLLKKKLKPLTTQAIQSHIPEHQTF